MKKILLIVALFASSFLPNVNSQCLIEVDNNGFEYTVDINLEIIDVIFTQAGSTCNANIEVGYDIVIDVIKQPGWWNESLYTLQGNVECSGGSGSSFFNLPNGGGTGTVISETFSYSGMNCSDVIIDCPIVLTISGPELNSTGPCGSLSQSPAAPVELIEFTSISTKEEIELKWNTASEVNFSHFELEISDKLRTWETMELIDGNNFLNGSSYNTFLPHEAIERYARLKLVDLDGSFEYSEIISLESVETNHVSVYPNPTSDILNFNNRTVQKAFVIDASGKSIDWPLDSNSSINVSTLNTGFYLLQVQLDNGSTHMVKFIKN